MGETLLHHWIFRVISYTFILASLIANMFSNRVARLALLAAIAVCAIWGFVNTIILCVRIKNDDDFARMRRSDDV